MSIHALKRSFTRRALAASALAMPLAGRRLGRIHPASAHAAAGSGDPFSDMLRLAPDGVGSPMSQIPAFADIAAELKAQGLTQPGGPGGPAVGGWIDALRRLSLPALFAHAADPAWRATFGFDGFAVDQSLIVGEPPSAVTLLRGRFDRIAVMAALTESGYRTVQDGPQTMFSISEDGNISLSEPANRLALAAFNNVAFLPDGTLAAASRLDTIRSVLAAAAGKGPSLADNPEVVTLFAATNATFASALILTGDVVSSPPRLPPIAEPGIAPFLLALTGVTPGGPEVAGAASPQAAPSPGTTLPGPVWKWALLTADRSVAAATAELIPRHIESGRSLRSNEPYSELFASWSTAVAPDGPVALLDIVTAPTRSRSLWIRMIQSRDLAFLA